MDGIDSGRQTEGLFGWYRQRKTDGLSVCADRWNVGQYSADADINIYKRRLI